MSSGPERSRFSEVLDPAATRDDASWSSALLEVADALGGHRRPMHAAARFAALEPSSCVAVVRLLLEAVRAGSIGEALGAACVERLHVLGEGSLVDLGAIVYAGASLASRSEDDSVDRPRVRHPSTTGRRGPDLALTACAAGIALEDGDWRGAGSLVDHLDDALAAIQQEEGVSRDEVVALRDACARAGQVDARRVSPASADLAPWDVVWSIRSGGVWTPSTLAPDVLLSAEAMEVLDHIHPRLGAPAVLLADLVRGSAAALSVWNVKPRAVLHLGDVESRVAARALARRLGVPVGRLARPEQDGIVVVYDLRTLPDHEVEVLRRNRHLLVAACGRFDLAADISLGPPPRANAIPFAWAPSTLWPRFDRGGTGRKLRPDVPGTQVDELLALAEQLVDRPPTDKALYCSGHSKGWIWSWSKPTSGMLPPLQRRRLWRAVPPMCLTDPGRRRRFQPVDLNPDVRRWQGWSA